MGRWRFVFGMFVGAGVGAFTIVSVRRLRRRLLAGWQQVEALLADVVLVASAVTVVADFLGAVGWFAPWPMAVGMVLMSIAFWLWGDPPGVVPEAAAIGPRPSAEPSWVWLVVAMAVGAVLAAWAGQLGRVYRTGMFGYDTLWYHLPVAADFVRTHSFLGLHFYGADIAVSTYPNGSEVFHAVGMVTAGSDILSPLINFGWAAVLVVAAHVLGRRYRCPHLVTLGALLVLGLPLTIQLEALGGLAEMMALACFIAAAAFMVQPVESAGRGRLLMTGLALGLVASTKLAMIAPAGILLVGCFALEWVRGAASLKRSIVPLVGGVMSTGAFWYMRNLWRFGNPIPMVPVGIGPWTLPAVKLEGTTGPMLPTLVSGLRNGTAVADLLGFGVFWPLVLGAPIVVLAVLPQRQPVELRVLAVVAFASLLAGLLTPQYLQNGVYQNISGNLRYVLPGVALATLIVCIRFGRSARWIRVGVLLVSVIILITVVNWQATALLDAWWGMWELPPRWGLMAALMFAASGVAVIARTPRRRRLLVSTATLAGVGVLAILLPTYLAGRYRRAGLGSSLHA